ncbi:MAG: hypothetical protein AAFQ87_27130 [Bacteroidota bacterium]
MNRDIRIFSNQFPPWFDTKPEAVGRRIAYSIEQVSVERRWPEQLFQKHYRFPDLRLLGVNIEENGKADLITVIGFCPLQSEDRFVILMGCDEAPDDVPLACLKKAEKLRLDYFNR